MIPAECLIANYWNEAPMSADEHDAPITRFSDDYAFLSNFYSHPIEVEGAAYPTNVHAFQALKTPIRRSANGSAPP